ncbi:MAG: YiiX/YebB-like N1pC/P60 family cysteine hydrolase [Planctomycetota bacterium]|jgi:hypothetical protein
MRTLAWIGFAYAMAGAAFVILATKTMFPNHRLLAVVVYALSWAPFLIGVRRHRHLLRTHRARIRGFVASNGMYAGFFAGLLLIGYVAWVLFPLERSPLPGMHDDELLAVTRTDMKLVTFVDQRLHELLEELGRDELLASIDAPVPRERLRDLWHQFLESSFELDLLKARYRSFYQVNGFVRPRPHAMAFVAGYGAFVSQYFAVLRLTELFGDATTIKTILNEADADAGVMADGFTALQMMTVSPDTVVQLNAGRAYLELMEPRLLPEDLPFVATTKMRLDAIDRTVASNPVVFADNPLDYFENRATRLWFPVQKNMALQMSHLRTTARPYFISHSAMTRYSDRLEPGDILVERREWHVTNLGIPGFWTHAALFVGSPAQLDRVFADLPMLGGATPREYLVERFPEVLAAMDGSDEEGHPRVVLEALAPGVIVQSLEASGHCDSLGVLRPRVSRDDRFRALLAALTHFGKPYDYDFDFNTDNELVCSEVIYKAYQGAEGFSLAPTEFNGRLLLSPNALVQKFDEEYDSEDAELEFVLFLDGSGRTKGFEERDAVALRRSWRRPKWHIIFN